MAILQAAEEYEARLAEALANAEPPSDPVERPRRTALEMERQFLAERGIKASPGIPSGQLLPHEGGDISPREKVRRSILEAASQDAVTQGAESPGHPPKLGKEVLAEILAERGIRASPGVSKRHLLPHEGGEYSSEERNLRSVLEVEEGLQERFGPTSTGFTTPARSAAQRLRL